MYTCTGSEAVDLALRIARQATEGTGILVMRNAYHGVTAAAVEISPSMGPDVPLGVHVRTLRPPDAYRAEGIDAALAEDVAGRRIWAPDRILLPMSTNPSTDGPSSDPAGFLKMAWRSFAPRGACTSQMRFSPDR